MAATRAILSIDAGTTGTRAAWVGEDGVVRDVCYRRLTLSAGSWGVIEQDAASILTHTIDAARAAIAAARQAGVEIEALALSTQRATAVLWDDRTGEPLAPAVSWQDTRFAQRLNTFAEEWDSRLRASVGRGVGIRSPFLWAADLLARDAAVAQVHAMGALRLGTIETWLLNRLSLDGTHVATASMAAATGGYRLAEHAYETNWIEALGCPLDILPALREDVSHLATTSPVVLGISVPILAALGDQLAGGVGLGAIRRGQVLCVHGTGSFVDVLVGSEPPAAPTGPVTSIVTARRDGVSSFALESFTANTGSALEWLCRGIGLFDAPADISRIAQQAAGPSDSWFVPSLTGLRTPEDADARGSFTGLSLGTTREDLARAVLEGIAHSVATTVEQTAAAARTDVDQVIVGGGLSASDLFLQLQADTTGIPILRPPGAKAASLRGAAFLAGSGLLWEDLEAAVATIPAADVFAPSTPPVERAARRRRWNHVIEAELMLANSRRTMREEQQ
ncbi:FGGY-family carbohydrate kinase [Microbacterium sp. EST19A]|uniref:FGGY-family carbohydrate kinase n=1 Tax=Microbacterium sp. EST19A TaxID=2862681 RepID=UPI001CBF08A4|nr:FGGY-family carbohydrate kinase [Microbacterium sp. EST19A]